MGRMQTKVQIFSGSTNNIDSKCKELSMHLHSCNKLKLSKHIKIILILAILKVHLSIKLSLR